MKSPPAETVFCALLFCLLLSWAEGVVHADDGWVGEEGCSRLAWPAGLPEAQHHFLGGEPADWIDWLDLEGHFQRLQEERRDGVWFAALIDETPGRRHVIHRRFTDPAAFEEFLLQADPLVEVWVRTAEGPAGDRRAGQRRLTAFELAALRERGEEAPTWITVTYPEADGVVRVWRVEFSLQAAAIAQETLEAYQQQRAQLAVVREILSVRGPDGRFSALAQWLALHAALRAGELTLRHPPPPPTGDVDPYVAYEFAVDARGRFQGLERVYRESEITKDLRGGAQQLILRPSWSREEKVARAFGRRLSTGELEPRLNILLGRDLLELRIVDLLEDDPRFWNVLEFGEPEVLRQSALAQLGLVNASLERRRKQLAWKKSTIDLYAEPAFAAANIGGGLAGAGFPFGEALRLAYNLTVSRRLLAGVPTVDELRQLLLLLAAKREDPRLAAKAADWLTREDLEQLQQRARDLPDEVAQVMAEGITDEDFRAMLSLARKQGWDARYRLFVDVLSGAARVAGVTDATFFGQLVNNPYFALNGDVSIKNVLAAVIGEKTIIYPRGGTMEELLNQGGLPKEWLQFFNVTVDVRALANTLHRLTRDDLAQRELRQPFPHAPRLDDLAAYEIRVFGFPLLIYHKRGLLKADKLAFETAYAYTVLGSRVVEHFATREDFEREILAGRVAPLGFVKVRDAGGRLRDSSLAVFARVLPGGRRGGRTGIVLYGMRAFEEHSALVERERQRYVAYERLLQEGGVIERVVEAEDRDRLPATTFEPVLHLGVEARAERFGRPLAGLRELERLHRLEAWGLELTETDRALGTQWALELARDGVDIGDDDRGPYLELDPPGSGYRLRRRVNNAWRTVELTAVTGPPDIREELARLHTAREVAQARRLNLESGSGEVVLINRAIELGGQTIMGGLRHDAESGEVRDAGLLDRDAARQRFWSLIEQLPLPIRDRLHRARFAGVPVDLDLEGVGKAETFFVTVEYPVSEEVEVWRDGMDAESECLRYRHGLLVESVTPRRITVFEYDDWRQQTASAVHANAGTVERPVRGPLLEETRSLEHWLRAPGQATGDTAAPRVSRVRLDHVRGGVSIETYGAFAEPVRVVDGQWLTERAFDDAGRLVLGRVWQNGLVGTDAVRSLTDRLLRPVAGEPRFLLRSWPGPTTVGSGEEAVPGDGWVGVEQADLVQGVTNVWFHDQANFGRLTAVLKVDPFDGTQSFSSRVTHHYRDDFHFGLVPWRSETRDLATGTLLSEVEVESHDPVRGETTGWERDLAGATSRKTWSTGEANPIRVDSGARRTETTYGFDGLSFIGSVTDREAGEELARFTGSLDREQRLWRVDQVWWWRSGLAQRTEETLWSLGGRRVATRSGAEWESRPVYDARGVLLADELRVPGTAGGPFDQLARREDQFTGPADARETRVQTFLDGRLHDEFLIVRDAEGRVVRDGMREYPGLRFHAELEYDGASDRVTRSREFRNGRLRLTRVPLPETLGATGELLLPVWVRPEWGLMSTQVFVLGDPWGRPVVTRMPGGSQAVVKEWYPGSAVARLTDLSDADGRVWEIQVTEINAGEQAGIPYDQVTRYRLGPGGARGLAGIEAQVRGVGMPLFRESAGRRVLLRLDTVHEAPWVALDARGQRGMSLEFEGAVFGRVLSVFGSRTNWVTAPGTAQAEPGVELLEVDVEPLFAPRVMRRWLDLQGNVLEEISGRMSGLPGSITGAALLAAAEEAEPLNRFQYYHEPGWLAEEPAAAGAPVRWVFTRAPPPATVGVWTVNQAGTRSFVSGVRAFRKLSPATRLGSAPEMENWLYRRLERPRLSAETSFLPGLTNAWTTWTARELDRHQELIYEEETVYDAQGRRRAAQTRRRIGDGQEAIRTAYVLVDGERSLMPAAADATTRGLDLGAQTDWSGSDFVGWQAAVERGRECELMIRDVHGNRVTAAWRNVRPQRGEVNFWLPDASMQLWLPNPGMPEQVSSVSAPASMLATGEWWLLAVAELAAAGLDVRAVSEVRPHVPEGMNDTGWAVSMAYHLRRGSAFVALDEARGEGRSWVGGTGGFNRVWTTTLDRANAVDVTGQRTSATVLWHDRVAAHTAPPVRPSPHLTLVWMDQAESGSLRPLYALSTQDGQFLKHFHQVEVEGAIHLYTIVNGFDTPLLEVFHRDRLGDEYSPGFIAYGYGYHASVAYQRGATWLARPLARLRNRVAANSFNYYGGWLGTRMWKDLRKSVYLPQYDYAALHDAATQAAAIEQLPSVAQALLPYRDRVLPRAVGTVPGWGPDLPAVDRGELERVLLSLQVHSFPSNATPSIEPTYLIPTAPGTAAARYVDTAAEAQLVGLATALGAYDLAGELLEFYRRRTREGRDPLHAAYDGQTGAAMVREFGPPRPMPAQLTAGAQLGMAEAALGLGLQTGDAVWLAFGRNLLDTLLAEYRKSVTGVDEPGLTRHRAYPARKVLMFELWPDAGRYPTGLNARLYLLLERLVREGRAAGLDASWLAACGYELQRQEGWLRGQLLRRVDATGVVPSGLFEIQDIQGRTSALVAERWTLAEDWLDFLEAAEVMGEPRAKTRLWLDNLLRIHGVRVGAFWGLDPGLPLVREAAISPDLTARLYRVAERLGHAEAQEAAGASLAGMRSNGSFPLLITAGPARQPLALGDGRSVFPVSTNGAWPVDYRPYRHWLDPAEPAVARAEWLGVEETWQLDDLRLFGVITGSFYASILIVTLLWWRFRQLRTRRSVAPLIDEQLLSEATLQAAEQRWARRVLGAQTPVGSPHTRFSNATLEQNFLMQLRALHKMVLEWRRQENGWTEDDRRLVEDDSDDWINGMDEFASCLGVYLRFVIKAGAKDGLRRRDALEEFEDSNHIWSRLVMYLAEPYWGMLTLLRNYNNAAHHQDRAALYGEISRLLQQLGVRQRPEGFDARRLFNYPAHPGAFDLLRIQQPGMTLKKLFLELSVKLRVPYSHLAGMVEKYRAFKRREVLEPHHPYLLEFAKSLPHFLLMGLGAVVVYNQVSLADSPVIPFLWLQAVSLFNTPFTLAWGLPLFIGLGLTALAHFIRVYRFEGSMLPRERPVTIFDATLTTLMGKKHSVMPEARPGRRWDPRWYEWGGWVGRVIGWSVLAVGLLMWEAPNFATFLVVKGLLAMLALVEVAGIGLPLVMGWAARGIQEWVGRRPGSPECLQFLNRLNFTPTRPGSPLWLAACYLFQPSVPSGSWRGTLLAILSYFGLAAAFFFIGIYLCQGILRFWFAENYLNATGAKILVGGLVFWNTMILLRYGLFLLLTALASLLVTVPLRALALLAGTGLILMTALQGVGGEALESAGWATWVSVAVLAALAFGEGSIRDRLSARRRAPEGQNARPTPYGERLARVQQEAGAKAGIVYMSGDDLGGQKLTPDLLMTRWVLLRDKFGSRGVGLARELAGLADDEGLRACWVRLHELERRHAVTLWHPAQLRVAGEAQASPEWTGLTLVADTEGERGELLTAWHIRRWVVTMMSTAGHSQDTAINLVDMALRLGADGLAAQSVFYLIQNKYDDRDDNRPVQLRYDTGELQQREKLSRLIELLAPGARAYNVQNWTPFGFKAGGMTGMDLVAEENLRLTTMVVLDRNATVNDLDGFMEDLVDALANPDLVIIIPGRGTTNTLTEIGQGSQMIEEGHRSYLKGLMSLMGGEAGECLGTGWGNIVAYTYGRTQRAMLNPATPKMPLTSRMQRGSSFAVRTEGCIGFAPHAVGISEDTWAVSQAMHNLVAMGGRVRFQLSRAFWHKIRETWSHAEWLTSFPRWSGGYLQMMQDGLMQRINDFGPLSVFARELRGFSGRAYLSAPFALFNILFLPLAILMDVTPFVQILIVLWNFGFIMNQVLTLHGLNVYLENAGFSRLGAVTGMAAAGAAAAWDPVVGPYAAGLVLVGLFVGGFWMGLSRWAYTRLRDMLLFGPQLVLHGLGQLMRQTIEFVISGAAATDAQRVNMAYRSLAGPREDQPLARYPHFINLRTVVWWVGVPSVLLNLLALSGLDMFNVILLLPSLLFSVSVVAGPFLMTPKPGVEAHWPVRFTKWLGWPAAFGFYVAVSMLIARSGLGPILGVVLGLGVLAAVFGHPLRYVLHGFRLRQVRRRLESRLAAAGLAVPARSAVAGQLMAQGRNPTQVEALLAAQPFSAEDRRSIAGGVAEWLEPALSGPGRMPQARSPVVERVAAEFRRTFCVALLTLLWFFVVPVPGLFVFTAEAYRVSMTLGGIMTFGGTVCGLAIAGYWAAEGLRYLRWRSANPAALRARARRAFDRLREHWGMGAGWGAAESSQLAAGFIDFAVFVDQKSDARARETLGRLETARWPSRIQASREPRNPTEF